MNKPKLLKAADPFIRVLSLADAIPPGHVDDSNPLSRHIPGVWPTLGELRELIDEIEKLAKEQP